jgi:hypothetical protein
VRKRVHGQEERMRIGGEGVRKRECMDRRRGGGGGGRIE